MTKKPVKVSVFRGNKISEIQNDKKLLNNEMPAIMDDIHLKNKHFTDEEIDRDIEYAKKHTPRSN